MPADAGITIHESRLLRTAHASMAHSRLPSGTFIVNYKIPFNPNIIVYDTL